MPFRFPFRSVSFPRFLRRFAGLLPPLALALGLFAGSAQAEPLRVVTSFSILADLARQVGGPRVNVHALVERDGDAHVYQPTPADARSLAQASLVVVNGLGFEGWLDRLVKSSGYRGKVIVASRGITPLRRPGHDHSHARKHGHDHDGDADPHAWQDAANVLRYVDNIAQALAELDPAGQADYVANAARYKEKVATLDAEIRQTFQALPPAQRRVVTTHDAFAYFGKAYGIRFISPVGVSTDAEASAADVARIIRQVRKERIPAVFIENVSDSRLLERIRQESGARLGGTLYSDSLSGDAGPAPTYLEMMRHNARALAAAIAQ